MKINRTRSPLKNSSGFTLIELAIALVITTLILIVVLKFWFETTDAFSLDGNIVVTKQQSERALEMMTDRIRHADMSVGPPPIVITNGGATINFVDSSDGSQVQYTLAPLAPTGPNWGQIVRTINGNSTVIASYVESLQFVSLPSTDEVITITARFHKGANRSETAFTLQSSVSPRMPTP